MRISILRGKLGLVCALPVAEAEEQIFLAFTKFAHMANLVIPFRIYVHFTREPLGKLHVR